LQMYVLRAGFLDGRVGLVLCGTMAYYTFLKDAKLWALEHTRPLDDGATEADELRVVEHREAA
jgi:hypothetical protein